MIISHLCKKRKLQILLLLLFLINSAFLRSQIKVFERPSTHELKDIGIFFESDTRKKIELNGQWEISFNNGINFENFIIPIAYDFKGTAIFRKKFTLPDNIINSYSFIFVAEGIDCESEVRINNNYISNHYGGSTPIINSLADDLIGSSNEILINVNSSLDYKNSLPLSGQINYSKVYGGITKDIYLLAVPKLYVSGSSIKYSVDNLLSLKVSNIIDISSTNLTKLIDTSKTKDFFVQTKVIRKSVNSEAGQSDKLPFHIGENNTIRLVSELNVASPVLWSPDNPELYILKSIISTKENQVIDEYITETGFTNLTKRNNQVFMSGKQIKIIGLNYYEDQPKFASALDYSEVEKDLKNIKSLGFNSIRVPGRSAHPYIVNLCNRLGIFLFQEIPFNEIASSNLDRDKYIRLSLNCLADIIERDKNSPCIFAWGIGNDFNVSEKTSLSYVKAAITLIDSLNRRFKYYTSRAYNTDICSEEVDFVGINFYESNFEQIKTILSDITNKTKPVINRKNNNLFISSYGLNIENNNGNGFSDVRSQEAQMKFLSECYIKISTLTFGSFISSYADWNSENPLNLPLDSNRSLKTSGLFTFNRQQKRSAEFMKRILNNEDIPRIQEGNSVQEFSYVFIIVGISMILILIYFVNKDKKFRSGLIRCLYKPTYFYSLLKDQMIISTGYNFLLAISISLGLSLYFSSILVYYISSNSFDMILAKIFLNDSLKILFSKIVNNKFYLILTLTILNLLLTFLTALFLYFISFYTKGKSFFKNIYTISVWSTLPMLIFLFIGTILYKLTENNPVYIKISLWVFVIIYLFYLNRIIIGAKSLFDIKTGKVYLYGAGITALIFVFIYLYLLFFTGVIETMKLVSNLTS